jgi:hypothetical protein
VVSTGVGHNLGVTFDDDGRWLELEFDERGLCVIPLRAFADTEEKSRFLAVLGEPLTLANGT